MWTGIQTFVSIIKRQFADRQTLLINTAHLLKFLEEYADRQAQIWKNLHKYHNLLDDVADLHLHLIPSIAALKPILNI